MYKVAVSYDGCTNWEVDLPDARGSKEACLEFISKHLPPHKCEFDLINCDTKRVISYLVKPAARRKRLVMQDTKPIE